jgi:hypothetical protein
VVQAVDLALQAVDPEVRVLLRAVVSQVGAAPVVFRTSESTFRRKKARKVYVGAEAVLVLLVLAVKQTVIRRRRLRPDDVRCSAAKIFIAALRLVRGGDASGKPLRRRA